MKTPKYIENFTIKKKNKKQKKNESFQIKTLFFIFLLKTGVYRGIHVFLICAYNIDCGYSLESPRRGGSNEYPKFMF